MPKANLTSWLLVFCLALLATPVVAQQVPATPDAVRKALNPPAPTKPATATTPAPPSHTGPAGAAPPAPATSSTVKPAAPPAPKSSSGSVPNSPAGSATSNANAKPAGNSAAKPASGLTPAGPKAAAGAAGNTIKPAGSGNKVAAPNSAATTPKPKSVIAAKSVAPTSVSAPALTPVAVRENISRRDPFAPLLGRETTGGSSLQNLPPGKPGLLISGLRIDGIVSGPSGMIAIVSNGQDRVYFLREGDLLFDGQVEHITMAGISFHQSGKDPFGNAVEREVAKRLNPSPGEQQ